MPMRDLSHQAGRAVADHRPPQGTFKVIAAGSTFGRWTVVGHTSHKAVDVRCECGAVGRVSPTKLRQGGNRSCVSCAKIRHGHAVRGRQSPTWRSWRAMEARCCQPATASWHLYGGKGITVCERWLVFENFLADMGERPAGTSLDRIDNTKGYEPGNCRWATSSEQARNKRTTRWLTLGGRTQCAADWAREFGITKAALYGRLRLRSLGRIASELGVTVGEVWR